MACHRLGAADIRNVPLREKRRNGISLLGVAYWGRSGVGIDVVNVCSGYPGVTYGVSHGLQYGAIVRSAQSAVRAGGRTVAYHLCNDVGTASHGMVIVLEHQRRRAAAWYQSVTVGIKRSAGCRRVVRAPGEYTESVKRRHGILVYLLSSATEYHVLHALAYHHRGNAYGVAAAGTCAADGKTRSAQVENLAEIHRHGGVHRLEYVACTDGSGVTHVAHHLVCLHDSFCRGVISEDAAHGQLTLPGLRKHTGHGHVLP